MAIGIKLKHNTGEITTGTGNLQLGAAGNLILDYATFPSADGTNTHVLSTDGAGNLSWVAQSGGSVTLSGLTDTNITTPAANSLLQYDGANWIDATPTTAHITEGANLYYTDARVDTRFDTRLATKDTGDLSEGSNLYFTNARADARITAADTGDLSEGSNLYFTNARADTRIGLANLSDLVDVHTAAPTDGQVLKWDNGNSRWAPATDAGGIALTDLSTTTGSASGAGTLAYNNGTGVFTFQPADLSSYLTSIAANSINDTHIDWGGGANQVSTADIPEATNLYYTDARADARADVRIAASDTGDLSEGSNLYFTNARADARVAAASLSDLADTTISGSASGQLLQWNGSAWVNATVSAASAAGSDTHVQFNDGGNIGADAGLTYAKATDTLTAGAFATAGASPTVTAAGAMAITTTASNGVINLDPHGSGQVVFKGNATRGAGQFKLNCEANTHGITIKGPAHSAAANYTLTLPTTDGNAGEILSTDGAGNLSWATDAGGIALTDLSVTTGSASGAGTLAYNNGTGVFTYQPADLSTYLTSTGVLSSHTDVHTAAPSTSDVLTWVASQSRWEPAAPQFTGFSGLTEEVVDTAADKIAFLDADNVTKKESIADFLTAIAGTNLTAVSGQLNASGGGGGGDTFKTIAVSGQSDVVADATTDTLTLVAGSNVTLTTDAAADSITIAASGGGGGGTVDYEEFKCNYHTDGSLLAASNLSSGISGVNIDSAAGGDVTVTFTGYTTPPVSIMFYGYGYASNIYVMNTLGSTGTTLRQLPGGGSSGSPTAFGSFSTLKIKIREAETGASRSFGTATHAWIRFVMGA